MGNFIESFHVIGGTIIKANAKYNIIWILFIIISFYIVTSKIISTEKEYHRDAEYMATSLGVELNLLIQDQFDFMDSVESFTVVNHNNDEFGDQFNTFISPLYNTNENIINISVAPQGIQKYVYPIIGNEIVIGHNLIEDSRERVRNDVQRTIKTKETAISGPYTLRQGGLGLIARKAIYLENNFWGLVILVSDFQNILDSTNIVIVESDYEIQIIKSDGELIYGDKNISGKLLGNYKIELPENYLSLVILETPKSLSKLRYSQLLWIMIIIVVLILAKIIYQQNKNHLSHIEAELSQRTKELNALNRKLDSSKMMAVESMMKGLSHKLSTFLGASLSSVTFLESVSNKFFVEINSNNINSNQLLYYQKSFKNALSLTLEGVEDSIAIIDNLKYISTSGSKQKVSQFKLKEYLEMSIPDFETYNTNAVVGILIKCPEDLVLNTYPSAIYQVMTLLIDNSIKHGFVGKTNGNITVDASKTSGGVKIVYSDDGIGIDVELLDKIFDPFYTSNMSKFKGLGLYTVNSIVMQQLSGRINVHSIADVKTSFTLTLPNLDNTSIIENT